MMNPGTSYTTFMVVAAFAGFGGGNFASSMTNINAFYPQRLKGWALGLNAGGGNIGVPVDPARRPAGDRDRRQPPPRDRLRRLPGADRLRRASAPRCSWTTSTNQTRQPRARWSRRCATRDSWVIALPLHRHVRVVHRLQLRLRSGAADQLPAGDGGLHTGGRTGSLHAAQIAFVGPLLGSIVAPVRRQARRPSVGGGKITLYTFVAMIFAAGILVAAGDASTTHDRRRRTGLPAWSAYVAGFIAAVHPVRHRQRLDLQDDPVDLRGQGAGPRTSLERAPRRRPGRSGCPAR